MIIEDEDLDELGNLLTDFAEKKEWTYHSLFEAMNTIEFELRLDCYERDYE
jgi:hypothetical protein